MSDNHNPLLGELKVRETFVWPSLDDWRARAESHPGELQRLVSEIPGGLVIEPLYTDYSASESTGWPGRAPFIRGFSPLANAGERLGSLPTRRQLRAGRGRPDHGIGCETRRHRGVDRCRLHRTKWE